MTFIKKLLPFVLIICILFSAGCAGFENMYGPTDQGNSGTVGDGTDNDDNIVDDGGNTGNGDNTDDSGNTGDNEGEDEVPPGPAPDTGDEEEETPPGPPPVVEEEKVPDNYKFDSTELSKYTLVFGADNYNVSTHVYELKNQIDIKYGTSLLVKRDDRLEAGNYEILIGDTNRDTAPEGKIMEYSLVVKHGSVKLNFGGMYTARIAIEYLMNNLFNGNSFALAEGTYYKTSYLSSYQNVTSGTTARVMSTNVLADAFNTDTKYDKALYRAEIFAGTLITHTPDVVGMQETDANWDAVLDEYLAKVNNQTGYQYERYLSRHGNKVNYTSFVYRADKYTVGNSGVTVFTWFTDAKFGHTYHMRNVGWVHLTLKSNTSKKFIVANTHWSYRTEHSGDTLSNGTKIYDNDLRTQCKNETNTLLSTLKNNYSSIPIFVTGDFNTSLTYFTNSGWLNSSYKVVGEQAKTAGTCITTVPASGHYDHIFGTGSYTIKRFEFFSSINKKDLLSDHPFVYADLAF